MYDSPLMSALKRLDTLARETKRRLFGEARRRVKIARHAARNAAVQFATFPERARKRIRNLRRLKHVPLVRNSAQRTGALVRRVRDLGVSAPLDAWQSHTECKRDERLNAGPRRSFAAQPVALSDIQRTALASLRDRGVAFVRFDDLIGDATLWQQVSAMADAFVDSPAVRKAMETFDLASAGKAYIVRQHPEIPARLTLADPLLRLALHQHVIDVVNAYCGMWMRLHYVDSWYTLPLSTTRPRVASQNWHRDYEDRRLVKGWLYFSDVTEDSGAMEYIPDSRRDNGKFGHLWRRRFELYPPAEAVDAKIPASERLRCVGPRGTLVLCDTTGLHRGGYATRGARLFSTWTFISNASPTTPRYCLDDPHGLDALSATARFALGAAAGVSPSPQ